MTPDSALRKLNLTALAQEGRGLSGRTEPAELPRLCADLDQSDQSAQPIVWQALAQWRERPGASAQLWLHLRAQAQLPLSCQRCLAPALQPLQVDRWFRFVDSEEVAQAEDEDCEEDLLVLEPQFDLLHLLEDELLMELPLVPMHERCAGPPAAIENLSEAPSDRPNPFSVLAGLKKNSSD